MADKLTWDEIKKKFPDEWVVLVEGSFDENEDPAGGVVYDHDPDRARLYARCLGGPRSTTVLYTGAIRGGLIGFHSEDVDQKS